MFGDHQPAEYITNSVLRVLGEDTATRKRYNGQTENQLRSAVCHVGELRHRGKEVDDDQYQLFEWSADGYCRT